MIFGYVQIKAADSVRLAEFYHKALDFSTTDSIFGSAAPDSVFLKVPGFGDKAPVFEIVQSDTHEAYRHEALETGYAHICFETENIAAAVSKFIKHGGTIASSFSNWEKEHTLYCRDIEGNIVEFHIPFPKGGIREYFHTAVCLIRSKLSSSKGTPCLRFIHVNIVCPDWEELSKFYEESFGIEVIGYKRNYSGNYIGNLIGNQGVSLKGQHMYLPGYCQGVPTLEIFTYNRNAIQGNIGVSKIGFFSSTFKEDLAKIEKAGGRIIEMYDDQALVADIFGNQIIIISR